MAKEKKSGEFYYSGFSSPQFTQVPNDALDILMPELSEAELKVLLYIIRRTFGWGKDSDAISLSQMIDGITTRDGRVLDRGTGLSRSSVRRGIAGLEEKGIIVVRKVMSEDGDYSTNVYGLRFRDETGVVLNSPHPPVKSDTGVVSNSNHRGFTMEPGVVPNQNPQETVKQKTEKQEINRTLETSNDPPIQMDSAKIRAELTGYVEDFAREFNDEAPLRSSVSRMVNIYMKAGVEMDVFIDTLYIARGQVKEWSASITKEATGKSAFTRKNRMPYFFSILEDLLGTKPSNRKDGRAS